MPQLLKTYNVPMGGVDYLTNLLPDIELGFISLVIV